MEFHHLQNEQVQFTPLRVQESLWTMNVRFKCLKQLLQNCILRWIFRNKKGIHRRFPVRIERFFDKRNQESMTARLANTLVISFKLLFSSSRFLSRDLIN